MGMDENRPALHNTGKSDSPPGLPAPDPARGLPYMRALLVAAVAAVLVPLPAHAASGHSVRGSCSVAYAVVFTGGLTTVAVTRAEGQAAGPLRPIATEVVCSVTWWPGTVQTLRQSMPGPVTETVAPAVVQNSWVAPGVQSVCVQVSAYWSDGDRIDSPAACTAGTSSTVDAAG